jgi:hypothetical protein
MDKVDGDDYVSGLDRPLLGIDVEVERRSHIRQSLDGGPY